MNSTTRLTVLSLLAAALLGLGAYSLLWISRAEGETSVALERFNELTGNDNWSRSVRHLQSTSSADVAILSEVAITRNELISLIEDIEEGGSKIGLDVEVSSITSESNQASTTPQVVRVVVKTKGQWQGSLAFIKLLQSLPVRSDIQRASLALDDVWETETTLKITTFSDK